MEEVTSSNHIHIAYRAWPILTFRKEITHPAEQFTYPPTVHFQLQEYVLRNNHRTVYLSTHCVFPLCIPTGVMESTKVKNPQRNKCSAVVA